MYYGPDHLKSQFANRFDEQDKQECSSTIMGSFCDKDPPGQRHPSGQRSPHSTDRELLLDRDSPPDRAPTYRPPGQTSPRPHRLLSVKINLQDL